MKRLVGAASIVVAAFLMSSVPARAHIGSPDVFFEGNAGPYRLFVSVKAPKVIPSVVEINVRSETPEVIRVETTITGLTGPSAKYAPTPDVARRSERDPQSFTSSLWLMQPGALRIKIIADGAKGTGELSLPVASFAQTTLKMDRSLGVLLFLMMIILAVGFVAIVSAAARESTLEARVPLAPARIRTGRIAGAIAMAIALLVIFVGGAWWNAEARKSETTIQYFKPPKLTITIDGGRLVLHAPPLTRPLNVWGTITTINKFLPDHGHLMHLFLIRTPGMDQMFHLHPTQLDDGDFIESLPVGAGGSYQVFADVVDTSGLPWTLTGRVELAGSGSGSLSGDDSQASAPTISSTSGDSTAFALADGGRVVWERDAKPFQAGVPTLLRFRVEDRSGMPASDLRPYMGMQAHAQIVRSDFSVFAHIHPSGSVPMASLMLAGAQSDASGAEGSSNMGMMMAMGMMMPDEPVSPEISLPYGFPQAGRYRIFVQFGRAGRVETAVFDTAVDPPPSP